jgi:hypothetical protein
MGVHRFGVPASQLQQKVWCPPGIYTFKVTKFKPDYTKDKQSINLNPELEICDTPGTFLCEDPACKTKHNDGQGNPGHAFNGCKPAFLSGNEKAMFIVAAMCHALGHPMVEELNSATGETYVNIPGEFSYTVANDPKTWTYKGPLTEPGVVGQLEVNYLPQTNNVGVVIGKKNNIKMFICKVPGCTERHPTDLGSK